ncbi:MAG: hypothetical protein U0325_20445 [Polyangiales bacterium]
MAYTNVVHRPERAQHTTNFNGQWLVVNLPPGAGYRVEAWGTVEGDGRPAASPARCSRRGAEA